MVREEYFRGEPEPICIEVRRQRIHTSCCGVNLAFAGVGGCCLQAAVRSCGSACGAGAIGRANLWIGCWRRQAPTANGVFGFSFLLFRQERKGRRTRFSRESPRSGLSHGSGAGWGGLLFGRDCKPGPKTKPLVLGFRSFCSDRNGKNEIRLRGIGEAATANAYRES
jgi:hypothetical protein